MAGPKRSDANPAYVYTGTRRYGLMALEEGTEDLRTVLCDSDGKLLISGVTGGGGGTEYDEGDTDASLTGGVAMAEGPGDEVRPLQVDGSNQLLVSEGNSASILTALGSLLTELGQKLEPGDLTGLATESTLGSVLSALGSLATQTTLASALTALQLIDDIIGSAYDGQYARTRNDGIPLENARVTGALGSFTNIVVASSGSHKIRLFACSCMCDSNSAFTVQWRWFDGSSGTNLFDMGELKSVHKTKEWSGGNYIEGPAGANLQVRVINATVTLGGSLLGVSANCQYVQVT